MRRWVPPFYLQRGKSENFDVNYLTNLISEGRRLASLNLPVIFSLSHLAELVGCRPKFLFAITNRRIDPYREFKISKRSGGRRTITVPEPDLLTTQKWILKNIITLISPHPTSTAYSKGNSIQKNASKHCGSEWLIKIDVERFFESITETKIYGIFLNIGFSKLLSFELARLCTRTTLSQMPTLGHLPQGAPTSPALANLACLKLDEEVSSIAKKFECTYTRYADDIVLSGSTLDRAKASQAILEIDLVFGRHGLRRNHKKTCVIPPGRRKVVTGLIIDGPRPKLQKQFKNNLRLQLYFARTKGVSNHCRKRKFRSIPGFKNHLEGLIRFASSVDKSFAKKCWVQFHQINWPEI